MGMVNAHWKELSPHEREVLVTGAAVLIDSLFDDYCRVQSWKPESILATRLGKHLPRSYFSRYTPLFFKQFGTCVVTVTWKLAQPEPLPPASVAERLAAWAILAESKELLIQESDKERAEETAHTLEGFLKTYVADTTFLTLFDPACDGIDMNPATPVIHRTSLAFENWFYPFSPARRHIVHPYACDSGRVGQAYRKWLTKKEQEMLSVGIAVLIDEIFDDFALREEGSEDIALTTLAWHLPLRYFPRYTLAFQKQFIVCILTVALKMTLPQRPVLASLGEELAAWAIVTAAKRQVELELELELEEDDEEREEGSTLSAEDALEDFREAFFEDEDFLFLYDDRYDGIDIGPAGQLLHMTSLAFADWLRPFTDEPSRMAHPYVYRR